MTTTLLTILIATAFILLVRLVSDRRHIAAVRHIQKHALRFAAANDTSRISVVIELADTVETVIPLLDRIHKLDDRNVEIIVTLAATAEPSAAAKLAYICKKEQRKNIKTITLRRNTTYRQLLAKRITGEIILRLAPNSSLSPNFFKSIRLAFLDDNLSTLTPRQQTRPDQRIHSGIQAGIDAWQQAFYQLFSPATPMELLECGTAYRRACLLNLPKRIVTARTVRSFIGLTPKNSLWEYIVHTAARRRQKALHIILSLALLAVIIAGLMAAASFNNIFIAYVLGGTLLWLYLFNQAAIRGLSLSDHISVFLLSPLVIVLDFFITILALVPLPRSTAEPFIER